MRTRLRKRLQQQQSKKNLKSNLPNSPKDVGQSTKNSLASGTAKQSNEQNTKSDKTAKFNRNKGKSVKSDVIEETEHNVKPIENLIEYIEGVEEKKVVKAKAKPKKPKKNTALLEEKKLNELESLNGNLLSCEVQIKQYLNQLMQIRRGKQKDPTRIKTAEEKLKEFTDIKIKYETEATQTIRQLKQINANFDITAHKELKYVLSSFKNLSVKNEQQKQPAPVNEVKSEADKRMVTIRRINLPYSQPQVTVTAKGTTPDQDQLLYAFVNGHLVPGAMISSNKKVNSTQNNSSSQQQPQQQQKSQSSTTRQAESKQQKISEPANNKKNQNTKDKDVKKKDVAQKNKKKQVEDTVPVPPVATKNPKTNKPAAKIKEEVQTTKNSKKTVKSPSESDKNPIKDVPSVNDSKSNNYIDPEFDNNTFKLLIMDDSDEESNTVSTASKSSKNKENSNSKKTTKVESKKSKATSNSNNSDKIKSAKIVDSNANNNNNKANKKKSNKPSKNGVEEPTPNRIIEEVPIRNGSKKIPKPVRNI